MATPVTPRPARTALLVALPVAVLAGLLAFWGLGGFDSGHSSAGADPGATSASPFPHASDPVPIAAPSLASRPATVCLALRSQLPDKLRDLPVRPVTAGAEQNAAYGDPAITLACGVTRPSVPPTATVYVLSGVCWYPLTAEGTSTWYTVDREVTIAVNVPPTYQQPGQWVTEFSAPIVASVPSVKDVPTGCK